MVQAVEDLSWRSCCEEKRRNLRSGLWKIFRLVELIPVGFSASVLFLTAFRPPYRTALHLPAALQVESSPAYIQTPFKPEEQLTRIHIQAPEYDTA
jgi:hypothetical protein